MIYFNKLLFLINTPGTCNDNRTKASANGAVGKKHGSGAKQDRRAVVLWQYGAV
jgi:hypothetical protein